MSKVWFITGSSRGLGLDIARAALAAGDRVAATARRPEVLTGLQAEFGENVLPIGLDVTDSEAAEAAVVEARQAFGRIDVVVNNAGYGDVAAFEDMSSQMFRDQIETNFFGVVNVTRAVVPVLREQGYGHIIQVSSIGARAGSAGLTAYQSAKWAVSGFSTGLSRELAPFGVQVTVLEPGSMRTDWAGSSMTIPVPSEPYRDVVDDFARQLRQSSGGEPTRTDDVAQIVLELADRDDPPLRLLIGADAVELAESLGAELARSDEQWRRVSIDASRGAS